MLSTITNFFDDDEPMTNEWLIGYITAILCSMMVIYGFMKMPYKTPPMLLMACVCSSCCSSLTTRVVNDVKKRV